MNYENILSGVVALPDLMDCSLNEFARRIRFYLEQEQRKISPDNGLIAILCDAARVGYELSSRSDYNRLEGSGVMACRDCPACEGHGYNIEYEPIYYPATREMAMDGGDMSLEGSPVHAGNEKVQIPCEGCHGTGRISREISHRELMEWAKAHIRDGERLEMKKERE